MRSLKCKSCITCRRQSRPPVSSTGTHKICQRLIGNSQPLLFTPTHHRERATMTETNLLRIPTEIRLNIVSTTDNAPRHRQRKSTNPNPSPKPAHSLHRSRPRRHRQQKPQTSRNSIPHERLPYHSPRNPRRMVSSPRTSHQRHQ